MPILFVELQVHFTHTHIHKVSESAGDVASNEVAHLLFHFYIFSHLQKAQVFSRLLENFEGFVDFLKDQSQFDVFKMDQ